MITLQIHKNKIKTAVVELEGEKLGQDLMRRWIDVPELIQLHLKGNDLIPFLSLKGLRKLVQFR